MTIPASVRLKLERAYEHLHALDEEIHAYLQREPYELALESPPSNDRLVVVFRVLEQPDERLGLLVGDVLTNIRASLDHLTCRLVERHQNVEGGDTTVTIHTQFPIMQAVRTEKKTGRALLPNVSGLEAVNVLSRIDALQPYQAGEGAAMHPLAVLNTLVNLDKHRLLHAVAARMASIACKLEFPDGRVLEVPLRNTTAHHDTPLGVVKWPEPFDIATLMPIDIEAAGDAFVGLDTGDALGEQPVTLLLERSLQFVQDEVVPALHPLLD